MIATFEFACKLATDLYQTIYYKLFKEPHIEDIPLEDDEYIVITGATSGLGLETVRILCKKYNVIATYRHTIGNARLSKLPNVKSVYLDLKDDSSIDNFTSFCSNYKVKLLINNASEYITTIAFEDMLQSNIFGTVRLTRNLISTHSGLKVINVSCLSRILFANYRLNSYTNTYYLTKQMIVWVTNVLNRKGTAAVTYDPGFLCSNLTRYCIAYDTISFFAKCIGISPDNAARPLAQLAAKLLQNKCSPASYYNRYWKVEPTQYDVHTVELPVITLLFHK